MMIKKIDYTNSDGNWSLKVNKNNTIEVDFISTMVGTDFNTSNPRVYNIPNKLKEIEIEGEYVFLIYKNEVYQIKFDVDGNFIGDIYDTGGNHIDSFACFNFYEEILG